MCATTNTTLLYTLACVLRTVCGLHSAAGLIQIQVFAALILASATSFACFISRAVHTRIRAYACGATGSHRCLATGHMLARCAHAVRDCVFRGAKHTHYRTRRALIFRTQRGVSLCEQAALINKTCAFAYAAQRSKEYNGVYACSARLCSQVVHSVTLCAPHRIEMN